MSEVDSGRGPGSLGRRRSGRRRECLPWSVLRGSADVPLTPQVPSNAQAAPIAPMHLKLTVRSPPFASGAAYYWLSLSRKPKALLPPHTRDRQARAALESSSQHRSQSFSRLPLSSPPMKVSRTSSKASAPKAGTSAMPRLGLRSQQPLIGPSNVRLASSACASACSRAASRRSTVAVRAGTNAQADALPWQAAMADIKKRKDIQSIMSEWQSIWSR